MSRYLNLAIAFLVLATLSLSTVAQELNDPYEILNRYFEAAGGLEQLRAEKSSYSEGTVALGGMTGTVKAWLRKPGQYRFEIELGPLNIIQADNGEYQWIVDQNGKLQKMTNPDDATANRRRVNQLLDDYAFADPESDLFTVSFRGLEKVGEQDCYVIKVVNSINIDSYSLLINVETFLPEKTVRIEDEQSRDVYHGDYREVNGIQVAFWSKEVSH